MSAGLVFCAVRACGGRMEARTDGNGRVMLVCLGCERFQRGRCVECARPRAPHSRRCAACGRARTLERRRQHDRERAVRRYHARMTKYRKLGKLSAFRAAKRAYMAAYRGAYPRSAHDRKYQREYMRMRRSDPVYRDRQNARKRELRALKKLDRAA